MERLREIAGNRPIPVNRWEADLWGYTEEEWQAILRIWNLLVGGR